MARIRKGRNPTTGSTLIVNGLGAANGYHPRYRPGYYLGAANGFHPSYRPRYYLGGLGDAEESAVVTVTAVAENELIMALSGERQVIGAKIQGDKIVMSPPRWHETTLGRVGIAAGAGLLGAVIGRRLG